jgi:hypothetical protein
MSVDELNKRMDRQDDLLRSILQMIVEHKAQFDEIKPAVIEIVSLWRGSKIIGAIVAAGFATVAGVWAAFVWARDHIK